MLLLSVEDDGRKTMVGDWGTIVERRMDSDSLGDAGVMLLVFGMLVCVSSQSMQQIAEVVIESCKWFAGRCKLFLLPDKSVDAPSGQVLSKMQMQRGLS